MSKKTRLRIKTVEDFWKYVNVGDPDACWEWTRGKTPAGYGMFNLPGQGIKYTHRYAFETANGLVLPKKMQVCHKCDNPPCCNPNHLFAGTATDNMQDMIAKGRANRSGFNAGEKHPFAKLNEFQVMEIRRLYATGEYTNRQLTEMFNVSGGTISNIVNWRIWKHVGAA